MKVQSVVKRDTGRLAIGMSALAAVMVAVFAILGYFDYTVVLGALLGVGMTVGNFFLLALTIQHNTEQAARAQANAPAAADQKTPETQANDKDNAKEDTKEDASDEPENTRDMLETVMSKKAGDEMPDYAKRAKQVTQLSYIGRLALLGGCLLLGALIPCFHIVAVVIPLLLQRFVLMFLAATTKDD